MSRCPECVPCEADDCDAIAYCLSQPTAVYPCPHGRVLCDEHNLRDCQDCRLDAEAHMYRSGEWSPAADPFYRPEAEATGAAYWDRTGSTFDPITNSYRRQA